MSVSFSKEAQQIVEGLSLKISRYFFSTHDSSFAQIPSDIEPPQEGLVYRSSGKLVCNRTRLRIDLFCKAS